MSRETWRSAWTVSVPIWYRRAMFWRRIRDMLTRSPVPSGPFLSLPSRRPLFHLLPVFQIAGNGFVIPGNDLLAFFQPFGDFPVIIVADPNLDGRHLYAIAIH